MYACPYVYWKEIDYDIISGHSQYEPICNLTNKHCYYHYMRFCKYRKENDDGT